MKVLLVNTVSLDANGISTFIINIASQLVKRNIDVTILAPNKVENKLVENLRGKGISIKEITERRTNPIKYFKNLKRYLSFEKFDVIHVNGNSTTMAIELFAAKLAGVSKRIAHSHNTTTQHPVINKFLRPVFEFSITDRLACNDAAGKWLFGKRKYIVVPNGIYLKKYKFNLKNRKKIRDNLKIKNDEILLGHVGEFNFQKNQIFLVNLIKALPTRYKLILIGQGENLKKVEDKVNEYKLSKRIIFTGKISNVTEYLNAMDIFILPSKYEGQPFALIEASASGIPCLVSDKVSKESNLVNNITFISLNDISKWIKNIEKICLKDRAVSSSKNILDLKRKGYDFKENISKLINVYKFK